MKSTLLVFLLLSIVAFGNDKNSKPNVLFICVDDLNDWIGCLGGHPQAHTPHMDRLAASGVLFTNAHCPAPVCNPSRAAVMSGIAPNRSGVYNNNNPMRQAMPDAELLPKYFSNHGYWSGGSGKILHYFIGADAWDDYYPDKAKEDPFPPTYDPKPRPVSLPVGGAWQYPETDWGAMPVDDETFGGDFLVSRWIGEKLRKKHDKPFFLACGIFHPHEPWFVPAAYYDRFPLDEIQLPPGYREDDLNDIPESGKKLAQNRYFPHILAQGQWKRGIQGYLASISYADAMLGRVLDALEQGPNKDNTIVVLWSDHGWHLGEKQHWQKFTGWRQCSRVPLMVRVPAKVSGLIEGTVAGTKCDQPVSLLSIYPTLLELCQLPEKKQLDGPSLVPLLRDPRHAWEEVAVTFLHEPRSFSVSGKQYRYIHYSNGDEELYDIFQDPYEWTNLAGLPDKAGILAEIRRQSPTEFKEPIPRKMETLPKLPWRTHADIPVSAMDGSPLPVHFVNQRPQPVALWSVSKDGTRQKRGEIAPAAIIQQQASPGEVWVISDAGEKTLGWFLMGYQASRAIIPANEE